jgi:hypothetical protein
MKEQLERFMAAHGFETVQEFVGKSLEFFSTHANLVERQREAKVARARQHSRDNEWKENIAKETESLATN